MNEKWNEIRMNDDKNKNPQKTFFFILVFILYSNRIDSCLSTRKKIYLYSIEFYLKICIFRFALSSSYIYSTVIKLTFKIFQRVSISYSYFVSFFSKKKTKFPFDFISHSCISSIHTIFMGRISSFSFRFLPLPYHRN